MAKKLVKKEKKEVKPIVKTEKINDLEAKDQYDENNPYGK